MYYCLCACFCVCVCVCVYVQVNISWQLRKRYKTAYVNNQNNSQLPMTHKEAIEFFDPCVKGLMQLMNDSFIRFTETAEFHQIHDESENVKEKKILRTPDKTRNMGKGVFRTASQQMVKLEISNTKSRSSNLEQKETKKQYKCTNINNVYKNNNDLK